jgi:uncharacterized protein
VTPIPLGERVSSLDTLRGVAVLGILLMNIVGFGLPSAADENPTLAGGATGANLAFWFVNHVLFEGKMRAIFSMLFGAGVIILTSRIEARAGGVAADIYYRRTLWLIGLGLFHSIFIWDGDILYIYGTTGLVLYPLRKLAPWVLIGGGLLLLAVTPTKAIFEDREIQALRAEAASADAAEAAEQPLSTEQKEAQEQWSEKRNELYPSQAKIDKDIALHRGGYWNLFCRHLKDAAGSRFSPFEGSSFFDAAGMMLIGMGLVKLGVFSAVCGYGVYVGLMLAGYGIGIALNTTVALCVVRDDFDPVRTFLIRSAPYDAGRLAVALGHVGLIMFVCKAGWLPRLTHRLAFVGRMALSNYLLQSLICTLIFYGYGMGLFGRLERAQLLFVVAGVWALELAASPVWLRYFRFGPVEWLWRSLTYWRWQPMLKRKDRPTQPRSDLTTDMSLSD